MLSPGGVFSAGSSPHTRGAQPGRRDRGDRPRIIPAYAGSTRAAQVFWLCRKDHPRIRGEHPSNPLRSLRSTGSSPHTRGARSGVGDAGVEVRIIPAYAGSTLESVPALEPCWDHPRIRGEHVTPREVATGVHGSSPHTRGAHRSMDGQT